MSFQILNNTPPIDLSHIDFFSHSTKIDMPSEIKELCTEQDLTQLKPLSLERTIVCLDWLADEQLCDHIFSEEMKDKYSLCETDYRCDIKAGPFDNSMDNFRWKKMFFLLMRVSELAKSNVSEEILKDFLVSFLKKVSDKGFPINEHLCRRYALPIIWAVEENQPALCWALIEMGVSVKSTSSGIPIKPFEVYPEPTLIEIAAERKRVDVIYRLLALGDDGSSLLNRNIYLDAKTIKHLKLHNAELNTYFYDNYFKMEVSPFILAGYHSNTEGMQTLIDLGVKVTDEDYKKIKILCLQKLDRDTDTRFDLSQVPEHLVRLTADPILSILKTFNYIARQHGFEPGDLPTVEHEKLTPFYLFGYEMGAIKEANRLLNKAVKEKLTEVTSDSFLKIQKIVQLGKNLLELINNAVIERPIIKF